jgi:hypothetical protein
MSWQRKYILTGFNSKHSALDRSREFALKSGIEPNATTQFLFSVEPLFQEHWGLVIPEDHLDLLEPHEKFAGRLQEILPPQPYVKPYIPMVFRYMNKQFVDEFFKTGSLRLSSFSKFHQYDDEQRGDKTEGNNMIHAKSGDNSFVSVQSNGSDAFILCSALIKDKEFMTEFNSDDCLIVEKPFEFLNCIASKIPEFKGTLFGPCMYQPEKIISSQVEPITIDDLQVEGGIDSNRLFGITNNAGGDHVYFTKKLEFKPQHEYRFLFFSWINPVPDELFIEIPEAIGYCSRIEK